MVRKKSVIPINRTEPHSTRTILLTVKRRYLYPFEVQDHHPFCFTWKKKIHRKREIYVSLVVTQTKI